MTSTEKGIAVVEEIIGHITEAIGGSSGDGGDGEDEESANGEQPQSLDILLRDYYAKVGSSERLNDGITRMGGTALAIILTVFGLLTVNKSLVSEVYWLIPLVVVFLVGILMQLVYRSVLISYYIRDLEDRIRQMTGTTPFFFENLTGRALYSPRTGTPAFLVLYGMYFAVIATAYIGLIVYCFHTLHAAFHIAAGLEAVYLGFYGLTTAIMIWALVFYLTGMGPLYDRWATALRTGATPHETRSSALIRYALLPRPFDFFVKTPITVANALLAAYLLGITASSLAHHWLRLIAVVVCVEFLGKQATYIWNDLLDADADRTHPHKKRRYFATIGSSGAGKPLLIVRTLCAFGLAAALAIYAGLIVLPPLIAAIFVVQFLYDRYAKPVPPARLLLAAVAYAERAIAGAVVPALIASSGHAVRVVIALSCWTVMFAVLFLAASWRAEDDYRRRTAGAADAAGRTGRSWFLAYGIRVAFVANLALVPLGLMLTSTHEMMPPRSGATFVMVGAIGVTVAWLFLTVARRERRQEKPPNIGKNGHRPAQRTGDPVPPWSRYALYLALAGLYVGVDIAFPTTPSLPFRLAFIVPIAIAAVYAYVPYEELTFQNVWPSLVVGARVLNQIIFTKKHLHDILHDLQPASPPSSAREISVPADVPLAAPMLSPEPQGANLERPTP